MLEAAEAFNPHTAAMEAFLGQRESDKIGLVKTAMAQGVFEGLTSDSDNAFWDTQDPASHARLLADGICPILLTEHPVYSFQESRLLLGQEKLWYQGFAEDIDIANLSSKELGMIAGSTMSVHVIAALLARCLLH